MITDGDRVYIENVNFGRFIRVYIADGKMSTVYDKPRLVEVSDGHMMKESLSFTAEVAQGLIDNLYKVGYRPSKSLIMEQSNRDQHLADMKKLVEKSYGVKFG